MTKLLDELKEKKFGWDIPDDFQDAFFRDRHLVAKATSDYAEANRGQTDGNLTQLKGGTQLWGASTVEENYLLDAVVREQHPKIVVEIGLYRGQTALTLNRALQKYSPGAQYVGFDISSASIAITNALLKAEGFSNARTKLCGFDPAELNNLRPDLVLIDGDHSYEGAARDLSAAYNACGVGGIILMHDIGSPNWGSTQQEPGILFHEVFLKIVGDHAKVSWLDSMCRDLTMRMLSPRASARNHYFDSFDEAVQTGMATMKDTLSGWGGMGVILKLSDARAISLQELIDARPRAATTPSIPSTPRKSIVSRALRKASELIP